MYDMLFHLIAQVCGAAAGEAVRGQYNAVGIARTALLQRYIEPETKLLTKAYLLIDILFSANFVKTVWPHTVIKEIDLRNKLRGACPNFTNVTARGWGFQNTFNPSLGAGNTLPILLHGFGLNKEVDRTDQNWARYRVANGSSEAKMTVRPALRSLDDPRQIVNLVLSCSLISSGKCSTASPLGFILNAPSWNIYGLAPKDINFANDKATAMTALQQAKGIPSTMKNLALVQAHDEYPTLASLINSTTGLGGDSNYNEVIVLGRSKLYLTDTKVTGIFVKVAMNAQRLCLIDSALSFGEEGLDRQLRFYHGNQVINAIKVCANTYHLPVVPILDSAMQDRVTDIDFLNTFQAQNIVQNWNCPLM